MSEIKNNEEIIDGLLADVIPVEGPIEKDPLAETIQNLLKDYNLSTDNSFIEKIAKMNMNSGNGKNESVDLEELPQELRDASFLPINTIADIALRQDLDLIISQLPDQYKSLQIVRDAICESDIVTGRLARNITFDQVNLSDSEKDNIMSKIETVEDNLELHQLIKNHMVFNTLQYGEGYIYVIPYAKVFSDLYKYRLNSGTNSKNKGVQPNMFETSSTLGGYGYSEQAVEKRLIDTVITEAPPVIDNSKNKIYKRKTGIYAESVAPQLFTESEIQDMVPTYHIKPDPDDPKTTREQSEEDRRVDSVIAEVARNISYIEDDVALPVIEQSAYDLKAAYETKYREKKEEYIQEAKTFFESVMDKDDEDDKVTDDDIATQTSKVRGVYTRILPATKLIPIRIDRVVIGYYYISDLTRPEESGERKNSGLGGYTLRSPSIGYNTLSPDRMFCERLANKIINNFNLKFMRDNTAIHKQIVAVLQSHKFNEARMRFVFIPAEHVVQCTINKDGLGKGHSMLEPGLVASRMYMFLKLYSLLYQINNSGLRVYNVRFSGIDKNYKQFIDDTMRKFAARRITATDMFNYRESMTKVSGGSELIMPLGPGDKPPVSVEAIPAAEAPINTEILESAREEAANSNPVPAAMTKGAMSEIEFAKEVEMSNTLLNSYTSSLKIDMNPDITRLYRIVLRWETDIDAKILKSLKFAFKMNAAKTLAVTSEMIQNFNATFELVSQTLLTKEELKEAEGDSEDMGGIVREYRKLMIAEYLPALDVNRLEELADQARKIAAKNKLDKTNKNENMVNDKAQLDEEMM